MRTVSKLKRVVENSIMLIELMSFKRHPKSLNRCHDIIFLHILYITFLFFIFLTKVPEENFMELQF